jgi:hypothetical protein
LYWSLGLLAHFENVFRVKGFRHAIGTCSRQQEEFSVLFRYRL